MINVLQVVDPRAPSWAGCYEDTYTTLFSLNFRLRAYSSVAKTIDAKVLTGSSLFLCVSLTTGQRKPGLRTSFQTQKDLTIDAIYNEVSHHLVPGGYS